MCMYLRENTGMSVKEVLVEDRVVVGQSFGQSRQTSGRDLLERCLVCLVSYAADVQRDTVLGV